MTTLAIVLPVILCSLIGGAAAWISWMLTSYPPARLEGAILNKREQALVGAAADAFFPPEGPIPLSGCDAGVIRYFDNYMSRSRRTQRFLTRLLLAFTEYSPLLFGPRRSRFSRLSLEQRIAMLDSASTSPIYFRRITFISLRALMTMAYLANGDVARHMRMVDNTDPFGLGARDAAADSLAPGAVGGAAA